MIRIAAAADIHSSDKPRSELREAFEGAAAEADLLLLCGDLTRRGKPEQAKVLLEELRDAPIPTVAVLGNHDFHLGEQEQIAQLLRDGGVTVLDGESVLFSVERASVAVAGVKGFCGGFGIHALPDFGEPILRQMYQEMMAEGVKLERALRGADDGSVRIAIMHYAPIPATLQGENEQIWPFLGSSRLAEAIDAGGANIAFHGHSHYGVERGTTQGGVPVHNVSMPVVGGGPRLFEVEV